MPNHRVTWYLPSGSGQGWPYDYERGRPSWPPESIGIAGLPSSSTVLELGAGTGKLTRLLIPVFHHVIALEPQGAMLRLLSSLCPDATLVAATGHQIPMPNAFLDAVFLAEASWFLGNERALEEVARVLRPGGSLLLMWNVPAAPWEPSTATADQFLLQHLPKAEELSYDPLDLNPRRLASTEWRQPFTRSPFEPLREARFPNPQTLDRDGLVSFLASMGWIADLADAHRLPMLSKVKSMLEDAEYRRLWETHVYWTRLRPSQD